MKIRILSKIERDDKVLSRATVDEYPDLQQKCRKYNMVQIGNNFYWCDKKHTSLKEIRALYLRNKLEGDI